MNRPLTCFDRAIVRRPAPSVVGGLRRSDRGDPSYEGILAEHQVYVAALGEAGLKVSVLPPLEAFPDSVFVEDPALVFAEAAILLRPAAPSRADEVAAIAPSLRAAFERVLDLPGPGFVDGGDVLLTPGAVLIGLSGRTDRVGAEALCGLLSQLGYRGELAATPPGVLHLKSDCALLDDETVLTTARLAASGLFEGRQRQLVTPEGEEAAANALRLNDVVLLGSEFPRTAEMLTTSGYSVVLLPTSEIARLDAGLSCMSLRWSAG